jgi:hypothetical protein
MQTHTHTHTNTHTHTHPGCDVVDVMLQLVSGQVGLLSAAAWSYKHHPVTVGLARQVQLHHLTPIPHHLQHIMMQELSVTWTPAYLRGKFDSALQRTISNTSWCRNWASVFNTSIYRYISVRGTFDSTLQRTISRLACASREYRACRRWGFYRILCFPPPLNSGIGWTLEQHHSHIKPMAWLWSNVPESDFLWLLSLCPCTMYLSLFVFMAVVFMCVVYLLHMSVHVCKGCHTLSFKFI